MTATPTATLVKFIRELPTPLAPTRARRGAPAVRPSAELFERVFAVDPELLALAAFDPEASVERRAAILLTLLASPKAELPPEHGALVERATRTLLETLPPQELLAIFVVLKRERINRRRARRAIAQTLLRHQHRAALAARHRATVRELLEHAFGRNTLRGQLKRGVFELPFVTAAEAAAFIPSLFAPAPVKLPRLPTRSPATVERTEVPRPARVTAFNRGRVSAAMVQALQGGSSPELEAEITRRVEEAAAPLPELPGHLAVVLDVSTSMRGYGERAFTSLAQAEALRRVMEGRAARTSVVTVGGASGTDLSLALLQAQAMEPCVVAVITDGYETTGPELARVVETMEARGLGAPVVLITIGFTWKDDLHFRRPLPGRPSRVVWHEAEFAGAWREVLAVAAEGRRVLKAELERSLRSLESQLKKEAP